MTNIEELLERADRFATNPVEAKEPGLRRMIAELAKQLRSAGEKIARVEALCDAEPPLQRRNGFCDHKGYDHDGPCAFCRVRAALKGMGEPA